MRLLQFRTMWGLIDIADGPAAESPYAACTFEDIVPVLSELGYDGVELPFKMAYFLNEKMKEAGPSSSHPLRDLLEKHKMKVGVMLFTDNVVVPGDPDGGFLWGGPYQGFTAPTTGKEMAECLSCSTEKNCNGSGSSPKDDELEPAQQRVVDTHLRVFEEQVSGAHTLLGPLLTYCVSHSAKDSFTAKMAASFFRGALRFERTLSVAAFEGGRPAVPLCHETHRGRFLYSPFATKQFLLQYPDIRNGNGGEYDGIKLCADLSHWACVSEAGADDPVLRSAVDFITPNVYHTHCRYGHAQGPQLADPRLVSDDNVKGHDAWWDAIWESQRNRGLDASTMIAEHGPPPYQPVDPTTQKPLASTWEVNHWIHLQRQKRFEELYGAEFTSRVKELAA